MADAAAEAKLRFLYASGHLYAVTAPATSAQLMLQRRIEIAGSARPERNDGSSSSCTACGTVLIPGWTSRTSRLGRPTSKAANPKAASKKHTRGKVLLDFENHLRVKCLACHRFEDTPLQKSKTSNNSRTTKATSQAMSSSEAKPKLNPDPSPLDTPSKASKRRERVRKHKSGLQAMLEKSKAPAPSSSGFGLDLLDLMKQD